MDGGLDCHDGMKKPTQSAGRSYWDGLLDVMASEDRQIPKRETCFDNDNFSASTPVERVDKG